MSTTEVHDDLVSDKNLFILELLFTAIPFCIMIGNLVLVAKILRKRMHTFNFILFGVITLFTLQHLAMLGETLAVFNSGVKVDTHNRFLFYQKKQIVNSLSNSDPDKPWVSLSLALMKTQELSYTVAVSSYSLLFQARFRVLQDALRTPRWVFPLLMVITILLMLFNFITLNAFHGEDIDIIAGTLNPAWVAILEVVMSIFTMVVIHKNKRNLHMASGSSNSFTTSSAPALSSHGKSTTGSVNVWADPTASQFSEPKSSKVDLVGNLYTSYAPPLQRSNTQDPRFDNTYEQHHTRPQARTPPPPGHIGQYDSYRENQNGYPQQQGYGSQQPSQYFSQQLSQYQQQAHAVYPPPHSDVSQDYRGHGQTQFNPNNYPVYDPNAKPNQPQQHRSGRTSEDSRMNITGITWLFKKTHSGRAGMYFAILRSATWLIVFTVLGIGTYASSFAVMSGSTFNIGAVIGRFAYVFNDLYVTSAIMFMGAIKKVMLK